MKISVIIPTFRPQAYLWQCLDALCAQTMPTQDWEVILVLNGEEAPYRSQIEDYFQAHTSCAFRLIYSAQAGVSHARNLGLQAAQGDYICFIDDDDYVSATYLQALYEAADKDTMPLSNLLCFKDEAEGFYPDHISANYQRIKGQSSVTTMQARKFLSGPVAKLIARDKAIQESFNPRFVNGEDALYIFSITRFYKKYRPTSPDAVYYRRVRSHSARHQVKARLKTMFALMWAYISLWIQHPLQYHFALFASRFLAIPKGIWDIYRAILKNK